MTGRGRLGVRPIAADLFGAALFAVLALVPIPWDLSTASPLVVLVAAAGVALRRQAPASALALVYASSLLQIAQGERPSMAQIATFVVLYSCAAYGTRSATTLSALSVLVGGAVAAPYLALTGARYAELFTEAPLEQRIVIGALPLAALALSWLAGYAVRVRRSSNRAERARTDAEARADDSADLARTQQVRADIARDVHDVVGHSLAVIITQADAAELVRDPEQARTMIENIGRTARTSLEEVRAVLSNTEPTDQDDEPDGETLDDVIAGVAAAAPTTQNRVEGTPMPLPPRAGAVARRVLQEMLTNALRHGAGKAPIVVQRTYRSTALIIEVTNPVAAEPRPGTSRGLRGMRARLAEIGGTLEHDVVDGCFVARVRIPIELNASGG